jgi:hypothetical protein
MLPAKVFNDLPRPLRYAGAAAYCFVAASILVLALKTWRLLVHPSSPFPGLIIGLTIQIVFVGLALVSAYELFVLGLDGANLPALRAPERGPLSQGRLAALGYFILAFLALILAYALNGELWHRSVIVLVSAAVIGEAYRQWAYKVQAPAAPGELPPAEAPIQVSEMEETRSQHGRSD